MRISNFTRTQAFLVLAVFLCACGGDSTGPATLDANGALQSLAIALNQTGGATTTESEANATFNAIAPVLDKVSVNIDGASQTMYALGLYESYPPGMCEEGLFVVGSPGMCTPISLTLLLILWQSHSATQAPDKLILLIGDPGTTNFDFTLADNDALAAGLFLDGPSKIWASESGTLTSQVASNNQSCNITLPPYAKSGTCSIATFAESGSIVFSAFSAGVGTTSQTTTIEIPSVTLHGIWLAITEVQPVPLGLGATPSRSLPLAPALLRVAPDKSQIPIRR